MKTSVKKLILCLALILSTLNIYGSKSSEELSGFWEKLPLSISNQQNITSVRMEQGGTLWIMANGSVYYWDGHKFKEPNNGKLTSGYYAAKLFGGLDRNLYVTQRGDKEHYGKIYELVDGQATYITDFYYDVSGDWPAIYISKSGRIFNWGQKFLGVYDGKEWKTIEAPLNYKYTLVFDTGENVHFYYNGNLFSVNKNGEIHKKEIYTSIQDEVKLEGVRGALWGQNTIFMLKFDSNEIFAYNLETGTPFDVANVASYIAGETVYDIFRSNDGSVCILTLDKKLGDYIFLKISPDGNFQRLEGINQLIWDNIRCWLYPNSILNASDGSVWFGSDHNKIARYSDGQMDIFGWKQGISVGDCKWLFEDPAGNIYAASREYIYKLHKGEEPNLPYWVDQWSEYKLSSAYPIRDSEGNIWMFLQDHPGYISRWNGYDWQHIEVPFDTKRTNDIMADNKGHVLVGNSVSKSGSYDISVGEIVKYENIQALLVAAVKRGATRFVTDNYFQGCVTQEGNRIWYGYKNRNYVYYYDGQQWEEIKMNDDIDNIYESAEYGVIFQTRGIKYYTYDRGLMKEIEIPKDPPARWLLGSRYLQPFEEDLLKKYPSYYIPVERSEENRLNLLKQVENDDSRENTKENLYRGDLLERFLEHIMTGYKVGSWGICGRAYIFRFFEGKAIKCSLNDCPLVEWESNINLILDDRANNLWIDAGSGITVFMKRANSFKIHASEVLSKDTPSLKINLEITEGDRLVSDAKIFWRLNKGQWKYNESGYSLNVDFKSDGPNQVEVIAMDSLGELSEPLSLNVDVIGKR